MSIKVIYLNNPAQEEEWLGYQYYLWYCFTMLLILYGKVDARMTTECPVCRHTLFEKNAGLYCYNYRCPAYGQKAIACCEGGPCWKEVKMPHYGKPKKRKPKKPKKK